ncbi:G5 domain-containing protein [Streptococcus infantis]|uniref:G5 domain-containing protein n=1 Tax=Streptococcus infantis TaxID=68892 RepID=UPI001CC1A910
MQVEELDCEKQTIKKPELVKGTQVFLQKSKSGRRQDACRWFLKDGVEFKKELIRSEEPEQVQTEIIEIGILVEEPIQVTSVQVC